MCRKQLKRVSVMIAIACSCAMLAGCAANSTANPWQKTDTGQATTTAQPINVNVMPLNGPDPQVLPGHTGAVIGYARATIGSAMSWLDEQSDGVPTSQPAAGMVVNVNDSEYWEGKQTTAVPAGAYTQVNNIFIDTSSAADSAGTSTGSGTQSAASETTQEIKAAIEALLQTTAALQAAIDTTQAGSGEGESSATSSQQADQKLDAVVNLLEATAEKLNTLTELLGQLPGQQEEATAQDE